MRLGMLIGVPSQVNAYDKHDYRAGWNMRSGQTRAVAAAHFENGEEIAHAQEFADPRGQVQQLQFTVRALRRNVKPHQRSETGTIHVPEFAEIQDHSLFI